MTTFDAASCPAARTDVASVDVDGELVIYDDLRFRLHRLNRTASLLWACLDGEATLGEISEDVADVLELDADAVLTDIVSLASQLADEGLIEGTQPERLSRSKETQGGNGGSQFVRQHATPSIDSTFPRNEEGSMTVRLGSKLLGLRLNTPALVTAARAVFAPSLVEDHSAPPNVSIVQARSKRGRPLYLCYRSGFIASRVRSIRAAIRTAASLLTTYADDDTRASLVTIEATLVARGGTTALIFPETRRRSPGLSTRLRADGWRVSDSPVLWLDPETGEVVVPPISPDIDARALEALPSDPLDGEPVAPGRYPVSVWIAPPQNLVDTSTAAGRLIGVAADSPDLRHDPYVVFRAAGTLLSKVVWRVAASVDAAAVARALAMQ